MLTGTILLFLLARHYSLQEFGSFTYAFAFGSIAFLLTNFGYNLFTVREISRSHISASNAFINTIFIKTFISLLFVIAIPIYIHLLKIDHLTSTLIWILSIAFIFNSFQQYVNALFKGTNIFHYESIISFWQNIFIILSAVICIFFFKTSIVGIAFLYLIGYVIGALINLDLFLRKNIQEIKHAKFSFGMQKALFSGVILFALHSIFLKIYFETDTLIVGNLLGSTDVAYFQAAMKLVVAVMFISEIPFNSFYPTISRTLAKNDYSKSIYLVKLMCTAGIFLTAFMVLFSKLIITALYGQRFQFSANLLFFAAFIIFIRFTAGAFGLILSAGGYQGIQVSAALSATFVSIMLNLYLIPVFGLFMAVFTSLIVNLLIFLFYYYQCMKQFHINFINKEILTIIAIITIMASLFNFAKLNETVLGAIFFVFLAVFIVFLYFRKEIKNILNSMLVFPVKIFS